MKNKYKHGSEIIYNAYEKYSKKERITYEEFVMMLSTNDELWFCYKDTEYQVIHETSENTGMCMTKYNGNEKISMRKEYFSSVIELLDKFRIEGKTIKDIWSDVTY